MPEGGENDFLLTIGNIIVNYHMYMIAHSGTVIVIFTAK
jgi:hypothetical protein